MLRGAREEYKDCLMPEFPASFPIFPLPGVVLFPGMDLPLHVFEPRYRQMAAHALEGERVLGMVLVRPGETPMQPRAPIFEVGCAGRMTRVQELPDGRYGFVLAGERRFRVAREPEPESGRLYRTVEAELLDEPDFGSLPEAERSALERAAEGLRLGVAELARLASPQALEPLRARMGELDPVELGRFLGFVLDCGAVEKQTLLEADDPALRLETLARIVEFRHAQLAHPGSSDSVN